MGQITIDVNEQKYTIACRDGEEERLTTLGEYVDSKAAELTASLGQVGETRILLMAALLIADELHEAMDRLAKSRSAEAEGAGVRAEAGAAALLVDAAKALEGIAEELENA